MIREIDHQPEEGILAAMAVSWLLRLVQNTITGHFTSAYYMIFTRASYFGGGRLL